MCEVQSARLLLWLCFADILDHGYLHFLLPVKSTVISILSQGGKTLKEPTKEPTLLDLMTNPVVLLLIALVGVVSLIATVVSQSPEQRIWTFIISLVFFILCAIAFWALRNRAQSQKALEGGLAVFVALVGVLMLLFGVVAYIGLWGFVYFSLVNLVASWLFTQSCQFCEPIEKVPGAGLILTVFRFVIIILLGALPERVYSWLRKGR